jgi:uncharacterized membrane protein YkoI
MPSVPAVVVLGLLTLTSGVAAQAAPLPKVKEEKAGLLAQAKITPDSAAKLGSAKYPDAVIQSAEIEEEDGRLIYSFDFKTAGKAGVDEVQVDAKTGEVVGTEHEDE